MSIVKQTEARRALKRAAVHVIECIYRRSPMFERFRQQKKRASKEGYQYQYQDVAQLEERNIQVFGGQIEVHDAVMFLPILVPCLRRCLCETPLTRHDLVTCLPCILNRTSRHQMDAKSSEIYYGTGRFSRVELLNLRESLDDRKTMEKLQVLREARRNLEVLTQSHIASRHWQLGELSDTQMRVKTAMRMMSAQARQLSALVKEHGSNAS